jgi:F-type H+-transporting ATPase subunit delta
VEIRTIVDPSILGGIVTRLGDTVIDGSVARSLRSLRETLQTR